MTKYLTRDAGAISIRAYEQATRLGHPYLGGEHFLLALAAAGQRWNWPACTATLARR